MIEVLKDMDTEAIADYLAKLPEGSQVAVLARVHFLLEKLSRLLDEKSVAHEYIGRITALTNSEAFRRYHAFLKLAINPYDNFSFLLIKDIIGLSRLNYTAVRISAAERGLSHFDTWKEICGGPALQIYDNMPTLAEIVDKICTLIPELSPEASAFILAWDKDNFGSIEDYLNWLALYEVQDEIKKDAKGISLQTIHSAKGLEWPVVILAGCNEGILPSKQSVSADDVEAERRLFYVAMTRAQDQLIMTVRPERTEKDGRIFESPQSRFIQEAMQ